MLEGKHNINITTLQFAVLYIVVFGVLIGQTLRTMSVDFWQLVPGLAEDIFWLILFF